MKTNKYLYGDAIITPIPKDIVDERVTALNKTLKMLLNEPMTERDEERIRRAWEAIDFWEKLGKKECDD